MQSDHSSRRIHVLRDSEARKIAAGEVIDRPLSVVRELLDNAIDSGATEISVHVDGGGIKRIRVTDNGTGMSEEDLELCILPHATSKIVNTEDIYSIKTLGFRGEALSSIAACSKLEITSCSDTDAKDGNKIVVHAGKVISLGETSAVPGTVVDVSDLFYSLPGRRKFLKRISSETQACKQAFIEKALPFHGISFRYFSDGELKLFLPPQTMVERAATLYERTINPSLWDYLEADEDGVGLQIVLTKPDYSRRDRRFLHVYVNNRRIQEFAVVQAITYGYSEHLPGGLFPAVFLSIHIDPALVDFNIHPAKREVRFRNLPTIHHSVVTTVRSHLSRYARRARPPEEEGNIPPQLEGFAGEAAAMYTRDRSQQGPGRHNEYGSTERPAPGIDIAGARTNLSAERRPKHEPHRGREQAVYHGQIFGLFLLAEKGDRFYIIDQHAAHERIIYEKMVSREPEIQNLLVPIHIELEEDEELLLAKNLSVFSKLGIILEKQEPGSWLLNGCPTICFDMRDDLADLIKGLKGDAFALEQELYATIACRSAVMDGEVLDDVSASELMEQALLLRNARCPHGRPIWVELGREKLFELVERTF